MSKREKVCLEILKKMIEANAATIILKPEKVARDSWTHIVSQSVDMTNQMLIELELKGGHRRG